MSRDSYISPDVQAELSKSEMIELENTISLILKVNVKLRAKLRSANARIRELEKSNGS